MGNGKKSVRMTGAASGRTGGRVRVRVRHEGAKLADPTPDDQGTDITGGWEQDGVATLRLNRAGRRVHGWLVDYVTKQLDEVCGDLVAPEQFSLSNGPAGTAQAGTLRVIGDKLVDMVWNGRKLSLERTDREPGFSDRVLEAFPPETRRRIEAAQRRPLTRNDRLRIVKGFDRDKIANLWDEFDDTLRSLSLRL